eukprot:gene8419-12977_t
MDAEKAAPGIEPLAAPPRKAGCKLFSLRCWLVFALLALGAWLGGQAGSGDRRRKPFRSALFPQPAAAAGDNASSAAAPPATGEAPVPAAPPATGEAVPAAAQFPSVVYENAPVLVGYNSFTPYEPENPRFGTCMFLYMALYAAEHKVNFVFYVAPKDPPPAPANLNELPTGCRSTEYCRHGKSFGGCHRRSCVGPKGCLLHPVWCKVKAVRTAHAAFTTAPFIIWLDTDTFVRFDDFHRSVATVIPDILSKRGSPLAEKPFVANQERPSWWTNKVNSTQGQLGVHYRHVINSGVFIVGAGPGGAKVIDTWWNSSLEDYSVDPLKHRWRTDWPWEQDRLLSLINEPRHGVYDIVQVLSDPSKLIQANWMAAEKRPGTCLSCLPRWRCFFYHCSDTKEMKLFWGKRTLYVAARMLQACATQTFPLEVTLTKQMPEAHVPGFPVSLKYDAGNWCPAGGWLHQLLRNVPSVTDEINERDCDYIDPTSGNAAWEKHYSMATKKVLAWQIAN